MCFVAPLRIKMIADGANLEKSWDVTVPWSQLVDFAGAAGPQCAPSHCLAGWLAAPSSPSVTQQTTGL